MLFKGFSSISSKADRKESKGERQLGTTLHTSGSAPPPPPQPVSPGSGSQREGDVKALWLRNPAELLLPIRVDNTDLDRWTTEWDVLEKGYSTVAGPMSGHQKVPYSMPQQFQLKDLRWKMI